MKRLYRNEHTTQHHLALALAFQRDCQIEIRGGGKPYSNLALNADRKNGPAARSFAADAHDRIMVRIKRSYRIQVRSTKMHPNGELPSDSQQTDRHQPDTEVRESPSRSSSSLRVLRRQGAAKTQATLSGTPLSYASISVP